MDEGERAVYLAPTKDYAGFLLFFFENGKAAKVEMSAYQTKTNRKKLISAYSDKSPLATALYLREDCEVLLTASSGRMLLFHTGLIQPKATKNTQGAVSYTHLGGIAHLTEVEGTDIAGHAHGNARVGVYQHRGECGGQQGGFFCGCLLYTSTFLF